MAEGYVTADQIMMYFNATAAGYCTEEADFCKKLQDYIDQNQKWIQDNLKASPNNPYWKHVSIFCKFDFYIYTHT